MAIYSTFFLCKPRQLLTGFPGWKPLLAKPVKKNVTNPFTGSVISISSREPKWDDVPSPPITKSTSKVVAITGDYQAYLQQRIPSFVQSLPHACFKGLTSIELNPLVATIMCDENAVAETALYAHPAIGAGIERLPEKFLSKLLEQDSRGLRTTAKQWSSQIDGWTTTDALSVIKGLKALGKQGAEGQVLYLLYET